MGNLGNYLRETRIQKGISAEYVVLHTSVNENILNALENEEYDYFHGYFYFINFLNEYLSFLGLDKAEIHSRFSDEIIQVKKIWNKNREIPINGLRYSNFKNRNTLIKGAIIIVILIILYFVLGGNSSILSLLGSDKPYKPVPQKNTNRNLVVKTASDLGKNPGS